MSRRVRMEGELGRLPTLPAGTSVELVTPDGDLWRYHCVGTTAPLIALSLGWGAQNVWLREVERQFMLAKRPDVFSDLALAIAQVLQHPVSVHANPRGRSDDEYFLADGQALRAAGVLRSRTKLVDLAIGRRAGAGGSYLRAYHFAPTNRNKGGRQLWP